MKKSTKIVSAALAAMMAASTLAVGTASVSAAAKVKKPTKVKAVNTAKGIKISWKKVKGAKKYRVYRGKKKITTTKKKTYTDKKAKAGKTYKYTVKAIKGKKVSKKSKAAKVVRLTKPVVSGVTNAVDGVKVAWKNVKCAKKYYVYRGTKKLATTTAKSYTDKTAVSGTKYSYKVKAVNGKSTSVFSAAKSITYVAAPVVKVEVKDGKATLTWDKVAGADRYQVYTGKIGDDATVKHDFQTETTFTLDLGSNPTLYAFEVYAGKGATASAPASADVAYKPEGCYFTDANGDLHVKIALKKGEEYTEGRYLVHLLSGLGNSDYAVTVDEESAKVVSVNDGVITAVAAGEATVAVELKTADLQKSVYNGVCEFIKNAKGENFGNQLTTGKVFVDVTVTE